MHAVIIQVPVTKTNPIGTMELSQIENVAFEKESDIIDELVKNNNGKPVEVRIFELDEFVERYNTDENDQANTYISYAYVQSI